MRRDRQPRLDGARAWRPLSLLLALGLSVGPVAGAGAVEDYDSCMALLAEDPAEAVTEALQWRDLGGGLGAEHCLALAMGASGQRRIAAAKLQELAEKFGVADPAAAATVMGQAAAMWTLARGDEEALAALDRAIAWRGSDAGLHLDRAHALAALRRDEEAAAAASVAIRLDPLLADAYALRAMIARRQGRTVQADEDVANTLALDPVHPQGLIERARSRAEGGDIAGARSDLLAVIGADPEASVAEDARRVLEKLDSPAD